MKTLDIKAIFTKGKYVSKVREIFLETGFPTKLNLAIIIAMIHCYLVSWFEHLTRLGQRPGSIARIVTLYLIDVSETH